MAGFEQMKQRFDNLKRLYFSNLRREYDEDGQEVPTCINRAQIAEQFENMGVEIPISPQDEMRPLPRKQAEPRG